MLFRSNKAADSRYIHRGAMNWNLAENISKPGTVEEKLFHALSNLEKIRKAEKVFVTNADTWTIETKDRSVLSIVRAYQSVQVGSLAV